MKVWRVLSLVAVLAAVPLHQAAAQFGGMPGMPGGGGGFGGPAPGGNPFGGPGPGGGNPFGGPQQGPPPQCQQLITLRDQVQKDAGAISSANQHHATAEQACRLFKVFLATESKMISAIETNGPTCGLPAEVATQVKQGHSKASQIAKQVCDAARGLPSGPYIRDEYLKIASEGGE